MQKKINKMMQTLFAVGIIGASTLGYSQDKAAFVYLGPTSDHGWTYSHEQGRLKAQKVLGNKIKTSYIENVPETADAERVIRNLAQQGNQVIFGTSFGYMNAMDKVAKQFPKTIFMHATGYKQGKNLGVYEIKTFEGAYMIGVLAGLKTKTNTIGVVASFPIPEVVRNINAYTLGAQSVNPKIETKVIWANTWFNPGKERDAALALISQGADVLMQNTDSPAVVQAAQQKGVYAFGWNSDMTKFGKNAHLAAAVLHWEKFYEPVMSQVVNKTWKTQALKFGVKEGAVNIENFGPAVSTEQKTKALSVRDALHKGTVHPFAGPIYKQDGSLLIEKSKVLSDAQLSSMNYYVKGVKGVFPQ
ncbi:BMP family ABC transporter substrate-binding protein [Acinetobacter shaoyimingii]|uniref:BMP family ABC transporter substrate-binding protein n=2 Tax=Acinetobacter shaoyimingii TaxID=2715164 RepID=A0A6G8RUL7_9GAMM|nr:BMP family ABC transporter substrate-binding protein [Acinetobacter shaoyimingii]QIO05632.1 BMP family ABC transporter substrate-binding protein [Acinetobacter shaoyimingii]